MSNMCFVPYGDISLCAIIPNPIARSTEDAGARLAMPTAQVSLQANLECGHLQRFRTSY